MLSADTAARILLAQLLPAASAVLSYSGNLCPWIEAAAELVAGAHRHASEGSGEPAPWPPTWARM